VVKDEAAVERRRLLVLRQLASVSERSEVRWNMQLVVVVVGVEGCIPQDVRESRELGQVCASCDPHPTSLSSPR
jgi:hypothetical protein